MGIKEELQEAGIALLNEDEKKEIVALFNAKLAAMGGGEDGCRGLQGL